MGLTFGVFFSLFTALVVIAGDYAIKIAADRAALTSVPMCVGVVLYAASAVLWFYAMRHVSLGQAAVLYSMLTLIALFAMGAWVFGEPVGKRELAGMACAMLAMILMSHADS